MLYEACKTAVVHPTGAGKSFIGYKLCEDHPVSTVCWLSTSEYIFQTQIENLKSTGADVPENIKFFTYAKLANMEPDEIEEIQPDLYHLRRISSGRWGYLGLRCTESSANIPECTCAWIVRDVYPLS